MLNFPSSSLVNSPASIFLKGKFSVAVRVDPQDDLARLRRRYGDRLVNFEIQGKSVHDLHFLEKLAGSRVRMVAADDCLDWTDKVLQALSRLDLICRLRPDAKLIRKLNLLTSFNAIVQVDLSAPTSSTAILEQAVDFYLHNPLLAIPIEPFHFFLVMASRRDHKSDAWEIQGENPQRNFYVSDLGEICLAPRWNARGLNFGRMTDSWRQIKKSPLFQKLIAYRLELFRTQHPCIFCSDFDLCGGFLRALEDDFPCESWQQVFKIIKETVKKAQELQVNIDKLVGQHA